MKIKLFFKSAVAAFLLLASFGHINGSNYETLRSKVRHALTSWQGMESLLKDPTNHARHFIDGDGKLLTDKYNPSKRACSKIGDLTYRRTIKNIVSNSIKSFWKEDPEYSKNGESLTKVDISGSVADAFSKWRSEFCKGKKI